MLPINMKGALESDLLCHLYSLVAFWPWESENLLNTLGIIL